MESGQLLKIAGGTTALYTAIYVLAAVVPGTKTAGYVLTHEGKPSTYHLNGFRVLVFSLAAFGIAVELGLPVDALYTHYAEAAAVACGLGLALSFASYVHGRGLRAAGLIDRAARCGTVDSLKVKAVGKPDTSEFDSRSEVAHFFCGLSHFNPTWPGAVDAKMWLYIVGAVVLQLNVISTVAAHVIGRRARAVVGGLHLPGLLPASDSIGWAMAANAGCLSFFLTEYMIMEAVHLQTYDLFRERIGFKLVWGCKCFYPFFYCLAGRPLASSPAADISPAAAGACVALFFLGWTLTRGANMQKAACKSGREKFTWCGVNVSMVTVPGSNGRVLCGGFWGVSRHVNYLGEILQAVALALPAWLATGALVPWLYPLYYVALFVPRQMDDDALCEAKYGKRVWGEYVARVPSRIVPLLY